MSRIAVIDIGNTSTSVGLAQDRRIARVGRMPSHDGLDSNKSLELLERLAGRGVIEDAVLCSVVPRLNPTWIRVLTELCGKAPLMVGHRLRMNVKVDYPHPETIGADRLANAVAGWNRYHAPVVVADFGTALTFDVITGDGRYIGGVIAPGLPLMTDYLAERTALLPHIELGGQYHAVGRSTREAMQIGAMVGYRGMVREIFEHVKAGMDEPDVVFCATGGYAARAVAGLSVPVEILPTLTLDGLVLMHEMNRETTKPAGRKSRTKQSKRKAP
jgi:type III pantothenate kinase